MVKHNQTVRRQIRRRIVWMCLIILWDWRLKGYDRAKTLNKFLRWESPSWLLFLSTGSNHFFDLVVDIRSIIPAKGSPQICNTCIKECIGETWIGWEIFVRGIYSEFYSAFCVLSLLAEVSILTSLVALILVGVEIYFLNFSRDRMSVT